MGNRQHAAKAFLILACMKLAAPCNQLQSSRLCEVLPVLQNEHIIQTEFNEISKLNEARSSPSQEALVAAVELPASQSSKQQGLALKHP